MHVRNHPNPVDVGSLLPYGSVGTEPCGSVIIQGYLVYMSFATLITLFGTRALSSVVLSVLGVTLNVRSERVVGWACWALVLLTAPIIATIAFNQTRRYKEPPSS